MQIIGDKSIDQTLKNLPNYIRVSALRSAARRAARPIISNARSYLKSSPESLNNEGQSKLSYVARNIRAVSLRSKVNPGVYVGVKGKDLPVGNRYWDVRAYAILLGEGSYKGKRYTRTTKANRGKFMGFGNFIQKGGERAGDEPIRIFETGIHEEVNKALNRAIKRNG